MKTNFAVQKMKQPSEQSLTKPKNITNEKKYLIIKDSNLTGSVQPYFNCVNKNVSTVAHFSMTSTNIVENSPGTYGIATDKRIGFSGGDSNPIISLSNGNGFMAFGDTFIGKLKQDGFWNTVQDPVSKSVSNSFCYIIAKNKKIFSNTYYVGNSDENTRTVNPFNSFPADINNYDAFQKEFSEAIKIGKEKNLPWASKGPQPILTPDYNNQVNKQIVKKSADFGFTWPLAGFGYPNKQNTSDNLLLICSQTFYYNSGLKQYTAQESQMVRIPNVASTTSDDIVSPYLWDKISEIKSFPPFMNKIIAIDGGFYSCFYQWTRSMKIDDFYYLGGSSISDFIKQIFLVRAKDPELFFSGVGFEAWTKKGWITVTSDNNNTIQLEPLIIENSDKTPVAVLNANQLSEIYKGSDGKYKMLFLQNNFSFTTNTNESNNVFILQSNQIQGPYTKFSDPAVQKLPPQYAPYFNIYEMRVSVFMDKFFEQPDGQKVDCVFHMVGQPYQQYGDLWYNGNSIYFTYFTQFFIMYRR